MSSSGAWPWPAEYAVLRIFSEGEGGIVALARKGSGELVALKLLRLAQDANPDEALTRHDRLRRLTAAPGLLQISACGLTADRLWLWEELELADNLDVVHADRLDNHHLSELGVSVAVGHMGRDHQVAGDVDQQPLV